MRAHGGNEIARLTVLDGKGGSIFGTGKYVVPVYQREFAWGEKEIAQLIEDVNDFEGEEYCLGTLVVDVRKDGYEVIDGQQRLTVYEVIDGQQRLTALFLLLAALGIDVKGKDGISLTYDYRKSSNNALRAIADVNDFKGGEYCLGTLVVDEREGGGYEVIDGQQRLTALFLLLATLGIDVKGKDGISLTYECRDSSDNALRAIADGKDGEDGLFAAFRTVRDILSRMDAADVERLKENLEKTVIFRVQVPANTDRNRYFEVMNTRGEQLEPADLVKADLMGMLTRESDRSKAAEIWQACSDMTGYVQMHFPAERRKRLFGERWNELPSVAWESGDASDDAAAHDAAGEGKADKSSIADILSQKSAQGDAAVSDEDADESEAEYAGVIGFPHFLLHTFKVYACTHGCEAGKGDSVTKEGLPDMLDDGKLKQTFDALKSACCGAGGKEETKFAREFVECMLCCRMLFDAFIVKREKRGGVTDDSEVNDGGAWSLKRLYCSPGEKRGTRKGYCVNTFRAGRRKKKSRAADDPEERQVKLQACLRVSYTSPKVMHWITRALLFLHEKAFHYDENGVRYADFADIAGLAGALVKDYERCLESVAQEGVKAAKGFEEWINSEGDVPALGVATPNIAKADTALQPDGVPALGVATPNIAKADTALQPDGVPALGVATPNIVFNYLDYILWRDRVWEGYKRSKRKNARTDYKLKYPEVRYDDFDFTFRTSVEHFYPRHPKNGEKWEGEEGGGVDNFGNLAILSRSKNSSFSNSLPSAKNVDNGILSSSAFSLKLRVMAAMLKEKNSVSDVDAWWREEGSLLHAKEMRGLLKEAFARLRPKNVN